jgi:hypothetical protein
MNTYDFVLFHEWMGINRLQMTSVRDKSRMVSSIPFNESFPLLIQLTLFRHLTVSLLSTVRLFGSAFGSW